MIGYVSRALQNDDVFLRWNQLTELFDINLLITVPIMYHCEANNDNLYDIIHNCDLPLSEAALKTLELQHLNVRGRRKNFASANVCLYTHVTHPVKSF